MTAALVNSFLDGIKEKKPFLRECLLYLGMHINYLDIQILRVEKKYFTPDIENELKYFTILTILRLEHDTYTKLYKQIQNNHYYEALSLLLVRLGNRDDSMMYYLRSATKAKEDYRITGRKGLKHISQGYEKVVKILIAMGAHVEEGFSNIVNNRKIKLNL